MQLQRTLLLSASVIAILSAATSVAAAADAALPAYLPIPESLPAVSAVNGKIGLLGGSLSGNGAFGASGSLAMPLGSQFGAQIDGLLGTTDSKTFYGIGGHVFWRDPSVGLLGGYASYVGWSGSTTIGGGGDLPLFDVTGADVGKVGVEAEAYLGRMSFEALGAYQFGSNTGFTGQATAAYYATDDLRLELGYNFLQGPGGSITAGGEWQFTGTSTSLFVDASYASSNSWSAVGGIKMYFGGEQKSLIRRHREDDPANLLPGDLYSIVGDAYCPVDHTLLDGFCDSNS